MAGPDGGIGSWATVQCRGPRVASWGRAGASGGCVAGALSRAWVRPAAGGPPEPPVICRPKGPLLLLLSPVLSQSCCQHLRFSNGSSLSSDQLVHQHIGLGQAAEADAAIQLWNRAGTGSGARISSES